MAVCGCGLAAQQSRGNIEQIRIQIVLDSPLSHQFQEPSFVLIPLPVLFFVGIKHLLCGREPQFVQILRSAQLFQEERQVVQLGKSREL